MQLIEYGIQLERSDVRIHVGVQTRRLYVFQTAAAQKLLQEHRKDFKERPGFQQDVEYATSNGILVPCYRMPTLRHVLLASDDWWKKFNPLHTPSEKGRMAARLAQRALKEGYVPLPFALVIESKDLKIQRSGADILLWGHLRIQVKCDWEAGPKAWGGSGNLFLQVAEINPLKRY
jgi:hypothetical protein